MSHDSDRDSADSPVNNEKQFGAHCGDKAERHKGRVRFSLCISPFLG